MSEERARRVDSGGERWEEREGDAVEEDLSFDDGDDEGGSRGEGKEGRSLTTQKSGGCQGRKGGRTDLAGNADHALRGSSDDLGHVGVLLYFGEEQVVRPVQESVRSEAVGRSRGRKRE